MTRALAWRLNPRLESLLLAGFLVAAYVCAHAHSPLYSSNQRVYFPHGLAREGFGLLEHDFFTQTITPYPVFGALVSLTYRILGED